MSGGLTPVSPALLRLFHLYLRWYVPRHFHGVRAAQLKNFQRPADGRATIVILNHPGWWDPLIAMLLARHAWGGSVTSYAPMDAVALRQYGFFRRLGLFPVEMDSAAGARSFLRDASAVVARPNHALWMTPQGHFADIRDPVAFRSGIGALLRRLPSARVLPVAIEYAFWDERLPEALLCCGEPVDIEAGRLRVGEEWTRQMQDAMAGTQARLAGLVQARDAVPFQDILRGKSGASAAYDLLRRARAATGGEAFQPSHTLVNSRGDAPRAGQR